MLNVDTMRLSNGFTVVTVHQPHLHSANVSLLVKCGSRHETLSSWGLSHFVEHMLYRGSQHFPDSRLLASVFERAGSMLQGSTWRDHTSLSVHIHPSHLKRVLTALGDMVLHPNFEGLDIERTIVEEEIQADLDETGNDADPHNISRACVWPEHAMGRRITGSLETLNNFTLSTVQQHHTQHYTASNMALCIAGHFDKASLLDHIQEGFGELKKGLLTQDGPSPIFNPANPVFFKHVDQPQTQLHLSFKSVQDSHPDFAALELLVSILDGGMGSRLRQAVCDKKGLVYDMAAGLDCYADCGLLDIEFKTAPRRAASAVSSVLEVLEDIRSQGVSEEELELAKEASIHALEFRSDSVDDLAHTFGTQALFNPTFNHTQEQDEIKNVSVQDIQRLAQSVFVNQNLHATVLGTEKTTNLKRIQKSVEDF
jgi:predicted Zn-dependent peptidase